MALIIDEWKRWQQGGCGTYAVALIRELPHLRLGGIDFDNDEADYCIHLPNGVPWADAVAAMATCPECPGLFDRPSHYVAHDDRYAYDSAGVHPLPYEPRWGSYGTVGEPGRWLPDMGTPEDHGLPDCYEGDDPEVDIQAALDHARRHGIFDTAVRNAP